MQLCVERCMFCFAFCCFFFLNIFLVNFIQLFIISLINGHWNSSRPCRCNVCSVVKSNKGFLMDLIKSWPNWSPPFFFFIYILVSNGKLKYSNINDIFISFNYSKPNCSTQNRNLNLFECSLNSISRHRHWKVYLY